MAGEKKLLARAGGEPGPKWQFQPRAEAEGRDGDEERKARMSVAEMVEADAPKVAPDADLVATLQAQVTELTHDLAALAAVLGQTLGQPLAGLADEIVSKWQTSVAPTPLDRVAARKAGVRAR